jgi:glycosyltransferase involved in cell wall biosynthesis
LKVLFVTGRLYPWNSGGVGNVQYHLTQWLSQFNDIDLTVLGTIPLGCEIPQIYSNNLHLCALQTPGKNDSLPDVLFSNLLYPISVGHLYDFDIIHFNVIPGLRVGTFFQLVKKMQHNSKLVLSLHGIPEEVELYAPDRLNAILSRLNFTIGTNYLSYFDSVVVNSLFVRSRYLSMSHSAKIQVIPNGIDSSLFKFRDRNVSHNMRAEILNYGNIAPIKGGEILIRAFAKSDVARKAHTLTFIGKDIGGYSAKLAKLARMLGVGDRVQIIKAMPRNKLFSRILECNFTVFPSLWEGFGIAVLEAMALGKSVIATCVGGPSDFINDGIDGYLINPRDVDRLTHLLDLLSSDPDLRDKIGKNALKKAEKYTWDKISKKYRSLYYNIL